MLPSRSAASLSSPVFTQPSSGRHRRPGPACVCLCLCAQGRVSGGSGVARGGGGGATRSGAELERSPPSSSGPLRQDSSRPSAPGGPARVLQSFRRRRQAPRRVSAAQRCVALGRRSLGGRVAGARRLGAPKAASSRPWSSLLALPPPTARAARPQSRPPRQAPGPPLSRRAPSGMGRLDA